MEFENPSNIHCYDYYYLPSYTIPQLGLVLWLKVLVEIMASYILRKNRISKLVGGILTEVIGYVQRLSYVTLIRNVSRHSAIRTAENVNAFYRKYKCFLHIYTILYYKFE